MTGSQLGFIRQVHGCLSGVISFSEAAPAKDAAVAQLQKQIDNIVQELNLLKEQQALQTREFPSQLPLKKESMHTLFSQHISSTS